MVVVLSEMVRSFAAGMVALFLLLGLVVIGLLAIAFGAASFLFVMMAAWSSARWLATHDSGMGVTALKFWVLAAVSFAVTPTMFATAGALRTWPERRRLARVAGLRLAYASRPTASRAS